MTAARVSAPTPHPAGVGVGLRWEFLDELLARIEQGDAPAVPFWEISPENYMRRGGYIPASLMRVAERFPIISHGLMMSVGGTDPFDHGYLSELSRLLRALRTPWHSDHLCFSGVDGRIVHDLLPMPQTEAAALHTAARIIEARERLEMPMCIENISFYLRLGEPELDEPAFIMRVLEEANCGLLLDVNNLYVNSVNHGFDAHAWLDAIDLGRVWQIHIAGHSWSDESELWIDTHGAAVIDPVYALLEDVIARTGPLPVLLERDNDVPPLDVLLAERARLEASYERGLARFPAAPEGS